jgi:hypothetical protein
VVLARMTKIISMIWRHILCKILFICETIQYVTFKYKFITISICFNEFIKHLLCTNHCASSSEYEVIADTVHAVREIKVLLDRVIYRKLQITRLKLKITKHLSWKNMRQIYFLYYAH